MKNVTIYHNPRCSKSRQTLQIIKDHGIQPVVVEYLKGPLKKSELDYISRLLNKRPKDFVRKNEAMLFNVWKTMTKPTQETLVTTSKQLMGIPYLWGGTSSKGVDCSGFTKTIYLMNGKIIPRDASQQVFAGEFVDDSKDFESLQPGDLIFFGTPATADRSRRVVHVGMWIGNNEFIHSSGRVRISSVDPNAPNFDEFNVNRYLESRRYIEKNEGNVIEVSDMFN